MNRKYDLLIKNLPLEKSPDNYTTNVIKESGILNQQDWVFNNSSFCHWFSKYSLACLLAAILLLTTIGFDLRSSKPVGTERLTVNTLSLVQDMTVSLKNGIFLYERSIER